MCTYHWRCLSTRCSGGPLGRVRLRSQTGRAPGRYLSGPYRLRLGFVGCRDCVCFYKVRLSAQNLGEILTILRIIRIVRVLISVIWRVQIRGFLLVFLCFNCIGVRLTGWIGCNVVAGTVCGRTRCKRNALRVVVCRRLSALGRRCRRTPGRALCRGCA